MRDKETPQTSTLHLQRVRCRQCQLPLLQVGEGDLLVTLHHQGEEITRPTPAYSYRTLTDPTPLRSCPHCRTLLTPTTVTTVHSRIGIAEEDMLAQKPEQND